MDINDYSNPDKLERWSFLWSEARLVIAAVTLLLGGVPVLRFLLPIQALSGLVGLVLTLTWILSGVTSSYLLYRWTKNDRMLFQGKERRDTISFLVSVISGLNLGITGLLGTNIGMSIASGRLVFAAVALIYLWVAVHLYRRWKASGEKVF